MWLTLWRKTVFVNIYPLLLILSKKMLKQIHIFLRICPFSNMVRKTNFLSISVLVSEVVTFMSKKNSSLSISPKLLQNNREAYFSNMWLTLWRKKGFVNIYPLLLIWSKKIFKQIQIFLRIFSFSNMVRKTYFLSISVLVSEIVTFMSKKNSFYEFPQKCFKTTERHSLAICVLLCG